MKNKIFIIYSVIINTISSNIYAQNNLSLNKNEVLEKKIKHYHVEEVVSMKFGEHIRSYNVSNADLISTYDLGPNGKRTITPVFEVKEKKGRKPRQLADNTRNSKTSQKILLKNLNAKTQEDHIDNILSRHKTKKNSDVASKEDLKAQSRKTYIFNIIDIYEQVVDLGYESTETLTRIADSYYYKSDFITAQKYYNKLFYKFSHDADPECYNRYSLILRSQNKIEMADAYLKEYNRLKKSTPKKH